MSSQICNSFQGKAMRTASKMPKDSKTNNYQSVSDVYAGKSIFVTGGTGFLGKVFIEKILYSCPKISKIYILTRVNRNMSVEERVQNMISLPLFNRLQKERPQDLNKIIPLAGDIVLPKLGLNPHDEELLLNEVSMVFHIAATIKLNESIQHALKTNFIGTKRVLDFSQRIRNIKAFIHVSTAYSNPNLNLIEEKIYSALISLEKAEQIAEQTSVSEKETLKILGESVNTYTFAKGLAENYVATYHGDIPTAIVRPSVVVASKAEPVAGWVDNLAGATGVVVAMAQGINRVLVADTNHTIDLIPVDFVTNAAIVAGARLKRSEKIAVFNVSTSAENPIAIGEFIHVSTKHYIDYDSNAASYPTLVLTPSKFLMNIITFIQMICAMLADCVLFFLGKKPRYVKTQSRTLKLRNSTEPFTRRSWTITAENTRALFESLNKADQKCFDFDLNSIVWEDFLSTYMQGVRKYITHEVK